MLPVMPAVHLKMNVAVITLPKPKNSIHIDVAHHNQNNIHIDVNQNNTHIEVAHHNHIDVNHIVVRPIANANQDLPLSHLDQAHIRAHHSIAHLDPPPDPHLEEDPRHEVILLFIDY